MCQLQSSTHQAVYVKSTKANHIPVVYIKQLNHIVLKNES